MIDLKELRIGNWISDDEGLPCKVNGLSPYDHSRRCDEEEGCMILIDIYENEKMLHKGWECESYLCSSIQLTEEWLVRFGFDKGGTPNHNFKTIEQDEISEFYLFCNFIGDEKNYRFGISMVDHEYIQADEISIGLEIKYVNQLQNLFYSLTGKELELK